MFIADLLRKQPAVEDRLPPIDRHMSPTVVKAGDDRLLCVIRLAGMPFESIDSSVLDNRFNALSRFLAAMGKKHGSRLSLWTHLHRRLDRLESAYAFRSSFMKGFAARYLRRFDNEDYYCNDYYLTLCLKFDDIDDGVKDLTDLCSEAIKVLSLYEPDVLSVYERAGLPFSEVYSFIGLLVNGIWEEIPLTTSPAYTLVPSSWLHFGYDLLEIRGDGFTKFATCYDLKDFPATTKRGLFNPLLSVPAEFVLTQSFSYFGLADAEKAIESQANKMESVEDHSADVKDLWQAHSDLKTGDFALGEYHGALVVFGPTVPATSPKEQIKQAAKEADNRATMVASKLLNECGARFVRATLSAPATYLSQVPTQRWRVRVMPKPTRSLAGTFTLHNFTSGKARGNPIGDGSALMPLKTRGNSLLHFNLHATKLGVDNTGERLAGHSLWLGTTGVGKTTAQLAVIGFLERFNPKLFALDNKASMKIFILATGGTYYDLRAGESTNLAPFALPDTPYNRDFLATLVRDCGANVDGKVSDDELGQIKLAVDTIMDMPVPERWFSRLLECIPDTGENCLARRLAKWCRVRNGQYAWAFDNDPLQARTDELLKALRVGFDVTDFLRVNYPPSGPVLAYLLHIKTLVQKQGGLLATVIEEFWLPLMFPTCANFIRYGLKTGRKEQEMIFLVSQSPEDAIASPIFADIIQMTATQIYLPNPRASFDGYAKCGLSRTEFDDLVALSETSRTLLIKQGNQSTFAVLDLSDLDDDLAILSGDPENVAILDRVIAEVGPSPDVWMPVFQQQRKGRKSPSPIPALAFA